jgi:hypothetical protein
VMWWWFVSCAGRHMIYRFYYAVPKYRGCLHPTLRWHSVLFINLCDFAFSYCAGMTVDALRGGVQVFTSQRPPPRVGYGLLLTCRFLLIPCASAEALSDPSFTFVPLTRAGRRRWGPACTPGAAVILFGSCPPALVASAACKSAACLRLEWWEVRFRCYERWHRVVCLCVQLLYWHDGRCSAWRCASLYLRAPPCMGYGSCYCARCL